MEAGGRIPIHPDSIHPGLGVSDVTSPPHVTYITIPIYWPEKVYFYLPLGNPIPMENGVPLLLDYSVDHNVVSESSENRYFIVVCADFRGNKSWEELILRSYGKYLQDSSSLSPGGRFFAPQRPRRGWGWKGESLLTKLKWPLRRRKLKKIGLPRVK